MGTRSLLLAVASCLVACGAPSTLPTETTDPVQPLVISTPVGTDVELVPDAPTPPSTQERTDAPGTVDATRLDPKQWAPPSLDLAQQGDGVRDGRPHVDGDFYTPPPPPPPPPVQTSPWRTVGPDLTQCTPPRAADLNGVRYVCDCAANADPDCVPGDDNNAGTGSAPWRSITRAVQHLETGGPGATVALCRGGAWVSGEQRLSGARCSRNAPCTIADYEASWASGDETRPRIAANFTGYSALFGIDAGGDWTVGGYTFENLHLSSVPGEGMAIFTFRVVNDVRMSCLHIEGFDVGVQASSTGARLVFEDGVITNNGHQGWMGGCNDCGLRRSRVVNNGFELAAMGGAPFAHNVYFGQGDGVARGFFIEASYLARASVKPNGKCGGTSLVVHGGDLSDLRIVGNIVEEPAGQAELGCWGIAVDSGAFGFERNRDVLIANNVVRNVGNVAIGLASCVRCTVENNVVVQESVGGAIGVAMPSRTRAAEDAASDDFVARNNTIYFGGSGGGIGVSVGVEGDDHIVANNVVAFAGQAGSCFDFGLPAASYGQVAANLCSGGTFDVGTVGLDSQSLNAAAGFVDAPHDLRLVEGSAAADSGVLTAASGADMLGRARDDRPDRGAYER